MWAHKRKASFHEIYERSISGVLHDVEQMHGPGEAHKLAEAGIEIGTAALRFVMVIASSRSRLSADCTTSIVST
jgi:hypothetical protein